MIDVTALLAWSALALLVTVAPGPDTMLVATHGARGGFRAGAAAALGVATGGVFYALLFGFGLLSVLAATPVLFTIVKIVGALYLLFLGIRLVIHAFTKEELEPKKIRHDRPELGGPYRQGLLTNVLNPKVALFYLAALPQFASGENAPLIGALLVGIHCLFGVTWLTGIALAASQARRVIWGSAIKRWFEGAVGAFFVAAAGRLAAVQR